MDAQQVIVLVYIGFGLLLAGLAVPMIMRLIPPNPFYGFRVPKTMNNPEIWYEINAYAGRWLFGAGLGTALFAALLYVLFPGMDKDLTATLQGVFALVLVLVSVTASFNRLKSM